TAANTLNGTINVAGGTLTLSGSGAINSCGAVNVYGGATLALQVSNKIANSAVVIIGTSSTSGLLSLNANNDTVGAVTLANGSITGSGTLTGSSYNVQEGLIYPVLGGGSSVALTKNESTYSSGSNTVTLWSANT